MHENTNASSVLTAGEQFTLHLGDNLETLKNYPDNTFDSIVTDPPYGIEFLGKDWDSHTGVLELWQECLRVLKPGGYLLAFSAARTYHQLASNIELAGFEIRDQLMWLYSSGFPKAQDIGKAIQKRLWGKPDKQRFDPTIMIKIEGDTYAHPETGVHYRKLPDINGDRLAKSHEGIGYGCVFEEIVTPEYEKFVDTTLNAGFGQTDHARVRAGVEWSTPATSVGSPKVTSPIAQQWEGFKTALKPAHEPIVMARKPYKGSTIDNVLKNGLGALNIDATRVPWADEEDPEHFAEETRKSHAAFATGHSGIQEYQKLDGSVPRRKKSDREICQSAFTNEKGIAAGKICTNGGPMFQGTEKKKKSDRKPFTKETFDGQTGFKERIPAEDLYSLDGRYPSNVIGEVEEGYQKYFYCPKVGRNERHVGFEIGNERICSTEDQVRGTQADHDAKSQIGNNHPTVKPVALMDYLIKLVTPPSTPELQRKVLDPFMGSGSTGMAATALGHHFTGCELDPKYVAIAETRIEAWLAPELPEQPAANEPQLPSELFGY